MSMAQAGRSDLQSTTAGLGGVLIGQESGGRPTKLMDTNLKEVRALLVFRTAENAAIRRK